MKTVTSALYRRLTALVHRQQPGKHYPVIRNANGADESRYRQRALFIYVTKPFVLDPTDPNLLTHQNVRQCRQIVAILDDLGYVVDVVHVNDMSFRASESYDLVISNRADFQCTDARYLRNATKIYLATTLNHTVHNANLRERHRRLTERGRADVQIRREAPERMPFVRAADAIVGFGNEWVMDTWKSVTDAPIHPFNNYGFVETRVPGDKNFAKARMRFLYFASGSQVQKGLDLLLEIFPKHPDLHLYVCSSFKSESDFCEAYRKELFETANIHPMGRIRVNEKKYDDLVRRCAFVITPSCSDGQSGSVVQCMYSGLVPLVTPEVGLDTEDFGLTFSDASLDEIERTILDVSQRPERWHADHSARVREVVEKRYSEVVFVERWREMLTAILSHKHVQTTL